MSRKTPFLDGQIVHQECLIAPVLQAATQGSGGFSDGVLQELHSYFSLLRRSSAMTTTGSRRKGSWGSSSTLLNNFAGQALAQSPQPLQQCVSIVMKKSPEAS
jgi:hypothetical protein